jgi:hypothetical protein
VNNKSVNNRTNPADAKSLVPALKPSDDRFVMRDFSFAQSLVFAGPVYRTENTHRTELD